MDTPNSYHHIYSQMINKMVFFSESMLPGSPESRIIVQHPFLPERLRSGWEYSPGRVSWACGKQSNGEGQAITEVADPAFPSFPTDLLKHLKSPYSLVKLLNRCCLQGAPSTDANYNSWVAIT